MKYVAFILVLVLISMTFCTPQESKQPKIQWKEIICPECKGTGVVKMSTTRKIAFGVLTLGCGFMCETTECDMCQGAGTVMQRVLNDSVELKEE